MLYVAQVGNAGHCGFWESVFNAVVGSEACEEGVAETAV